MLFVGIDVAKSKHDCCIISSLDSNDFTNVKIGLESTGHYSTNITNYLYSKGFSITVLNPLVTNAFRKAGILRKTKTDKCDAKVIATMLFSDESKSYSPSAYQIQELKSLTRHRYRMIGYRSKLKLFVTRLIDIIFPELPDFVWSIHQSSSYQLLLASNSIGSSNRSLTFELQQTIRLIQSVQSEIDSLDRQIKLVVDELNTPLLTIPGIGYTIAAIILAEIGDINNFSSPAKLLAFAGMKPSTYQSGKYNASKTPMVKRGSTYLRWAIMQAARLVSMRDSTFATYMAKKRFEGKHFNVAQSHVGKKLIRVIYSLLKNNTAYIPQM